jgi:hypothetical protein
VAADAGVELTTGHVSGGQSRLVVADFMDLDEELAVGPV